MQIYSHLIFYFIKHGQNTDFGPVYKYNLKPPVNVSIRGMSVFVWRQMVLVSEQIREIGLSSADIGLCESRRRVTQILGVNCTLFVIAYKILLSLQ